MPLIVRWGIIAAWAAALAACAGPVPADEPTSPATPDPLIPTGAAGSATQRSTVGSGPQGAPVPGGPQTAEGEQAWRFGFSVSDPADPEAWARRLGAEWYLDWRALERGPEQWPLHWQMVRVSEQGASPSPAEAAELASRFPGGTWVIGNEPDVIWQDNTTPEGYARRYQELYRAIKGADPSARIAVGAIAQVTPLRLKYLDRVLAAYEHQFGDRMPADVWTVHAYVLREQRDSWGVDIPPGFDQGEGKLYEVADHGRLDLFEAQLRDFRAWMAEHGYRESPLALTEFGILMPNDYGFPPERVAAYMAAAFDLLLSLRDEATGLAADDHRLVQRWAWFSLASASYPTGDLVDLASGELSPLGEVFQTYTRP